MKNRTEIKISKQNKVNLQVMEKQNVVDEQKGKKKVYLKANTRQTWGRRDKQKARFISYIFFEVLLQNLKKKKNIRAGNWGGSFLVFFRMFDHNFLDLVQIEGEMQRDEIQKK
uniref:(northern house mosquito) hypothetical protein n=1 Tax=Culex pipiens TaxID=7175 RepID=A0A8D8NTE5_CULPI